ncbi:hypothetical protein [Marinobacter sp. OP 3.4]|uniref:hypothetical protein n=1 Tax=Marinobacter sp. OP 3.4 TaxID=3076501 RepID=UPI002E1BE33A
MRDKLDELHHARNRLNSLGDRVAGPEPQADSQEENKELGPNCLMDDLNAIHRKVAFELDEIHGELNRIEKYI